MLTADDCLIFDSAYVRIDAEQAPLLIQSMSFSNPDYKNAIMLGEDTTGISKTICFAEFFKECRDGQQIYKVPRNFSAITDIQCSKSRQETISDKQYKFEWPDKSFTLRPWQAGAVDAYMKESLNNNGTGIISLACGKGKTVAAIRIIYLLGVKTLVLVDQLDLAVQWKEEITRHLGIVPAMWIGSERKSGPIVIATLQSLHSHLEREIIDRRFFTEFSMTVLDECHVAPARTFSNVMSRVRSKYVLGLSATVNRADGLTAVVNAYCGPIVYQDLSTELKPQVMTIEVNETPSRVTNLLKWVAEQQEIDKRNNTCNSKGLSTKMWGRSITFLSEDRKRNVLVCSEIANDYKDGHSILVLSTRVEHCMELNKLMKSLFNIDGEVMVSETAAKERKRITEDLRSGKCKLVFATTVFKKGKDVPALSCMHLVLPVASEEFVIQGAGRILRKFPDKPDPILIDYIDMKLPKAVAQAKKRIKIYNSVGWKVH